MCSRAVGRRAIVALLIAGCLLLHGAPTGASENAGNDAASSGRRIFFGEIPLRASILGYSSPLPPERAACVNCHAAGSRPASDGLFAPPLDRSAMIEPRRRRNGPPSHFSPASFCQLLRTGVDPVYIIVSRQMPRYQLDDAQCLELWHYLMELGDGSREEKQ
jgi:hypothetical protein